MICLRCGPAGHRELPEGCLIVRWQEAQGRDRGCQRDDGPELWHLWWRLRHGPGWPRSSRSRSSFSAWVEATVEEISEVFAGAWRWHQQGGRRVLQQQGFLVWKLAEGDNRGLLSDAYLCWWSEAQDPMLCYVIDGTTPILFGRPVMERLGMAVGFSRRFAMEQTCSGRMPWWVRRVSMSSDWQRTSTRARMREWKRYYFPKTSGATWTSTISCLCQPSRQMDHLKYLHLRIRWARLSSWILKQHILCRLDRKKREKALEEQEMRFLSKRMRTWRRGLFQSRSRFHLRHRHPRRSAGHQHLLIWARWNQSRKRSRTTCSLQPHHDNLHRKLQHRVSVRSCAWSITTELY